jgi:DNA polymerase sigma
VTCCLIFLILQQIGYQNKETVGELLLEYFRYYAWLFDFHNNVVSIQSGTKPKLKLEKYEKDGWFHSDVLR